MRTIAGALWVAAFLLPLPSHAGSLSLVATTGAAACPTVTAPAGGALLTAPACITGSDAELGRIVTAYRALLALAPESTSVQVFNALAASLWAGIKANVVNHEAAAAKTAAEAGVGPVGLQ